MQYFDLVFDIPSANSFTYQIDDKQEAAVGKRAMVPFGKGSKDTVGFITDERETLPDGVKESAVKKIRRVIDSEIIFDNNDIELARWIADYYLCGIGQALSCMLPSGRKITVPVLPDNEKEPEQTLSISDEQAKALNAIIGVREQGSGNREQRAESREERKEKKEEKSGISNFSLKYHDMISNKNPKPQTPNPALFYLYGITGSGKTEVFLRAAQHTMNQGKGVIYLVPEISLTHQTAKMITRRFGSSAAVLHSGMSASARFNEWMRIRRGDVQIVVGPRSAVFAPVPNLGMIIIDEEQDSSYKSGNTPRYHARQIALKRCQLKAGGGKNAVLVMGSATPSVEAWKLMEDAGHGPSVIKRLNLTRRLSGGGIPQIKTVSLAAASGCLTKELKDEIRATANMGRQTILFLNRRGFAHFYHCSSCGAELTCKRCSVSLTWHKHKGRCICHYCGYSEAPPKVCPKCGSIEAGYRGFGTELIEEEVRRTFPDLRIKRIDTDIAAKKSEFSLENTLTQFKNGEIDILLGTQMVAKGLNFPGVRLVGVVLADTGLHLPDFRAAERTFSLIVQVAGRAGRYFSDGKVIVQTLRMSDPVITRSCAMDIEGFYKAEIEQRRMLSFPPFSRLIRFTIRAKELSRAKTAIKRLASFSNNLLPKNADILGPSECPIGMINNNYRFQLILRGPSMNALHAAAKMMLERYDKGKDSKVYLEVDVDPVSML